MRAIEARKEKIEMETTNVEEAVKAAETVKEEAPNVVKKAAEVVAKHPNDIVRVGKYVLEFAGAAATGYVIYKTVKTVKGKIADHKAKKNSKDDSKTEEEA